jgi:hypothetical protein
MEYSGRECVMFRKMAKCWSEMGIVEVWSEKWGLQKCMEENVSIEFSA